MDAASLRKRVDAAVRRVGGMSKPMYLRVVDSQTGDDLIGRATKRFVDTIIDPQPAYHQLAKRDLIYLTTTGRQVTADDYSVLFSPLAITEEQLQQKTVQLVLKDPSSPGEEEVLRIIYVNGQSYQAQTVSITAIARSVSNSG